MILEILFYSFVIVVFLQVIIYFLIYGRFVFLKSTEKVPSNLPVSVIVCAKNEADNLRNNLPHILDQNYSNFEVVLINDSSQDETLEVMEEFAQSYPNIKIVNVKEVEAFWGNKKYALTLGIKASKNELLLLTDADCKPVSKSWITEMTCQLNNDKEIVLGYGAHTKVRNSFLNKLVRFETLITAIRFFSFAKLGIPYMGVGRNLAYKKSTFFKTNGFMSHMRIKSGDDDLFINQIATAENTSICFGENSFTTSKAKTTFASWLNQKRRHISTSKYYQPKHKIALTAIYLVQFLFWTLTAVLIIFYHKIYFVIGLMLFRLLLQYIILGIASKRLAAKDLIIVIPFLEIFLIFSQLYIFIRNIISKPDYWK